MNASLTQLLCVEDEGSFGCKLISSKGDDDIL